VMGALTSASRAAPRLRILLVSAGVFGVGCVLAALMPNTWLFGLALVLCGVAAQTFSTTANSTVQLATDAQMRGRVMAIYLAISLGGTPIGAPIVGWVADAFGPRWSLVVAAVSGFLGVAVGLRYLVRHHGLHLHREEGRWRLQLASAQAQLAREDEATEKSP